MSGKDSFFGNFAIKSEINSLTLSTEARVF